MIIFYSSTSLLTSCGLFSWQDLEFFTRCSNNKKAISCILIGNYCLSDIRVGWCGLQLLFVLCQLFGKQGITGLSTLLIFLLLSLKIYFWELCMTRCQLIVMFVSLLLFIVISIFRIVISHEDSLVILKSTACMLRWFNSIIKYLIERERAFVFILIISISIKKEKLGFFFPFFLGKGFEWPYTLFNYGN